MEVEKGNYFRCGLILHSSLCMVHSMACLHVRDAEVMLMESNKITLLGFPVLITCSLSQIAINLSFVQSLYILAACPYHNHDGKYIARPIG